MGQPQLVDPQMDDVEEKWDPAEGEDGAQDVPVGPVTVRYHDAHIFLEKDIHNAK